MARTPSPHRASPLSVLLAVATILVGIAVIAIPLSSSRYPAMTDLPFHASETSTLRHYFDPAYHFREQFSLQLFRVPYLMEFGVGALLMLVFSPVVAMKIAAGVMLSLLPLGLAVLLRGMKKSPLLGILGLTAAWGPFTQWGFLNFIGAIGLYAMVLGLTLLVVERPSIPRRVALSVALTLLFTTHIFRFPIALVGALGTAFLVAQPLRRALPVVLPLVPPALLFVGWILVRPASLRDPMPTLSPDLSRLRELPDWLTGSFDTSGELSAQGFAVFAVLAVVLIGLFARSRGPRPGSPDFHARVAIIAALAALGSLVLFLSLPMEISGWWCVYPREAMAATFLMLAAIPDLPKAPVARVAAAVIAMAAPVPIALNVAENYAVFDAATADFYAITRRLPQAPKLSYLVFEHGGATHTVSPFTHLPAWVQAERGGWLSFHFVKFGASPIAYRQREGHEDVIPPPTPPAWELTPEKFDVLEHGRFFEWFLVRKVESPAALFEADSTIEEVSHEGTWWLYRRTGPAPIQSVNRPRLASGGDFSQ